MIGCGTGRVLAPVSQRLVEALVGCGGLQLVGTRQITSLVTGGAGFIGFHLCRRLLDNGEAVICLDDMTSGSQGNVDELSRHGGFRFVNHDISNPITVHADRIFNLACPASPPFYEKDPIKTIVTNVMGVRNMLELARSTGAHILQASTSEVYGDPLVHPQPETYHGNVALSGPRACYDEGKRCAEVLMQSYRQMHGTDIRIARIFNTYGPAMRQDDGRVVSNFIQQALRGDDLTVYGDGSHTRSFCYVDDLIDGLIRLMELATPCPDPVNLGNPQEISILAFAQTVINETGSKAKIAFLPEPENDPRKRCPNISRAKSMLGWEPRLTLEDGLRATVAYFRKRLETA